MILLHVRTVRMFVGVGKHLCSTRPFEVPSRADAQAGDLAKAYDAARIAGQACEAAYTALIN